jgi:hypothetical protein
MEAASVADTSLDEVAPYLIVMLFLTSPALV